MTETAPALLEAPGKNARNKGRELVATACNNLAVALVLAAFVQPIVIYLQQRRPFDLATGAATLIFLMIAAALFAASQRVVKRLEDRTWIRSFSFSS